MKKLVRKIMRQVTVNLQAGDASVVDLGKMLGPLGLNLRAIKAEYDAATAAQRGDLVPLVVSVFEDRGYALRYKSPPTAFLIRRAVNGGTALDRVALRAIALRKLPDLNTDDLEAAMRTVAGTARSMGIPVSSG
jgi:large subunit ribosomal protein L11